MYLAKDDTSSFCVGMSIAKSTRKHSELLMDPGAGAVVRSLAVFSRALTKLSSRARKSNKCEVLSSSQGFFFSEADSEDTEDELSDKSDDGMP